MKLPKFVRMGLNGRVLVRVRRGGYRLACVTHLSRERIATALRWNRGRMPHNPASGAVSHWPNLAEARCAWVRAVLSLHEWERTPWNPAQQMPQQENIGARDSAPTDATRDGGESCGRT